MLLALALGALLHILHCGLPRICSFTVFVNPQTLIPTWTSHYLLSDYRRSPHVAFGSSTTTQESQEMIAPPTWFLKKESSTHLIKNSDVGWFCWSPPGTGNTNVVGSLGSCKHSTHPRSDPGAFSSCALRCWGLELSYLHHHDFSQETVISCIFF